MIISYLSYINNGIILQLKVFPNAAKNQICDIICDASGQQILKVKITATAEDGKANKALLKFLAKEWGIAISTMEIISGKISRIKKLKISGDNILISRLVKLMPGQGE